MTASSLTNTPGMLLASLPRLKAIASRGVKERTERRFLDFSLGQLIGVSGVASPLIKREREKLGGCRTEEFFVRGGCSRKRSRWHDLLSGFDLTGRHDGLSEAG